MKKRFLLLLTLLLIIPTYSLAQDSTVRVSTRLVEVDVVVTDKNGKYLKDLTADDFEIYENGKLQAITNFTYVEKDTKLKTSSSSTGTTLGINSTMVT
ncbi:MAG: hypothetical protein JNN15_14365, partial [Blastocatellia bacterium]|nr:hypothetical protein [Blastocatellia bacterium]